MGTTIETITIEGEKFRRYVVSLQDRFLPNNEASPTRDKNRPWESVDVINLYEQESGTIIFLKGNHFGADYRIRVNGDDLEIWREIERNGLKGPIDSIVSWEEYPNGAKIEQGLIRKGSRCLMPYFSYDKSKPKLESVQKPKDLWIDTYLIVYLQKPEK